MKRLFYLFITLFFASTITPAANEKPLNSLFFEKTAIPDVTFSCSTPKKDLIKSSLEKFFASEIPTNTVIFGEIDGNLILLIEDRPTTPHEAMLDVFKVDVIPSSQNIEDIINLMPQPREEKEKLKVALRAKLDAAFFTTLGLPFSSMGSKAHVMFTIKSLAASSFFPAFKDISVSRLVNNSFKAIPSWVTKNATTGAPTFFNGEEYFGIVDGGIAVVSFIPVSPEIMGKFMVEQKSIVSDEQATQRWNSVFGNDMRFTVVLGNKIYGGFFIHFAAEIPVAAPTEVATERVALPGATENVSKK